MEAVEQVDGATLGLGCRVIGVCTSQAGRLCRACMQLLRYTSHAAMLPKAWSCGAQAGWESCDLDFEHDALLHALGAEELTQQVYSYDL